jgi:hypothetical protein
MARWFDFRLNRTGNGQGESGKCRSIPLCSRIASAGLSGGPSPNYFLGAAVSEVYLTQRKDKKKADPKTSLKVFRRGCLKGRSLFGQIALRCKCEEQVCDCTKRNHPWEMAIFLEKRSVSFLIIRASRAKKSVSERNDP